MFDMLHQLVVAGPGTLNNGVFPTEALERYLLTVFSAMLPINGSLNIWPW